MPRSMVSPSPLPPALWNLPHLHELLLLDNQISEEDIDDKLVATFTSLLVLDLSRNSFSEIPKSFLEIPRLETLHLLRNKIEKVPSDMGRMKCLKVLGLSGNQLKEVPLPVCDLPCLEVLYLNYNLYNGNTTTN
eukprot:TRINITY_DN5996_c0_g1_i1.p1 TRINITY_DN5996_c0_g1~~TRINITY_DN5996_c0_g1_i1.p1  ORF type:complete len:134 (+),score=18.57 TRINITY_DN5996_c0_g1_i1:107-508(+)